MSGNESRPLFDYYLDHPRDYFKVSGEHYIKKVPFSDVRIVLTVVILLISWFFYTIQYQKYEKAVRQIKQAVVNNLGVKNGGTKETLELYRRATERYDRFVKNRKVRGDKTVGKNKMQKDPVFLNFVNEVVNELKIEGGYRKPNWKELVSISIIFMKYLIKN